MKRIERHFLVRPIVESLSDSTHRGTSFVWAIVPTMREITEENVEGTLKNTAHSLTDAMFGSFAGVVALLYSGTLMDRFGARSVALLGMGIMVIPVTLSLFMLLKKKQ